MPEQSDTMRQYADNVYNSFSAFYTRVTATYAATRLRYKETPTIPGLKLVVAPTARALATVTQFVALADNVPHATVLPKDNTEAEDKKTDKIEAFLDGVPRAIRYFGMHPYKAYLHNFSETGIGSLLIDVDEDAMAEGRFPFVITAPAPESIAYAFNKRGLLCCVVKEDQEAGGLYRDLKGRWDAAEADDKGKKKWNIPDDLADMADSDPMRPIDTTYLYTPDKQYFWVRDARVWERENWLGCVPLAVGLCMPIPSSKPEEYAFGMVYPALPTMINEERMLGKAYTGFEFFTFPLGHYEYQDGHSEIQQVAPGETHEGLAKVTALPVSPNYESMRMLTEQANISIGRVSIPDNVQLGDAAGNSGYQENILQFAPSRRIDTQMENAGTGMAQHFSMLLKGIETLATEQAANALGIRGKEKVDKYLSAFSTVSHPRANPDQKALARVVLSKEDVKGYTEVEVTLQPEAPQDENAKYNRAKLARDVGKSNEGIFRDVLKEKNPDQEFAWQREDMLKNDPMWSEFLLRKAQKDVLAKDPKLAAEFQEFVKAKEEAMAEQQPPAPQPEPMQPPMDPMQGQGQMMPTDMSLMNPNGGLQPNMTGFDPSQLSPQMAGQVPTSPIDALIAQQMQGGMPQ